MSFLDHLEELRWLLVRSSAAVVIMACVTYFISDWLFDVVIFGPTRIDFYLSVFLSTISSIRFC